MNRPTPPGQSPSSDAPPLQRHVFGDGARWTVRLYVSRYDRRSRPDLLFETDGAVRRVRDYPDDWMTLDDDALYAVSHRR